jgi:general secretion pathway protein M
MIARLKNRWCGLSPREQILVGIMAVLLALVIVWLGIARPLEAAYKRAVEEHGIALDRHAAVRHKVALLKALPPDRPGGSGVPLAQMVGESAGEAGFTLERVQEQGPGRIDIAIGSVRSQAVFGWLAGLEAHGVRVETFSAQPSGMAGTVSVQAVLQARAP